MEIKRTAGVTFRRPIRTPRVPTLRGSAWSRLLLTVTTLCILGVTRQATVQAIGDLTRRFQAELDRLQQAEGFPGATAAFALPDGRVVGVAMGVADRETGAPMTSDTKMLTASIGKMFVAATALGLAREGKLDLDQSIEQYLGDEAWFPRLQQGRDMTLRMLLSHSAGVRDYGAAPGFIAAWEAGRRADPDYAPTPRELISYVLDKPPLFPVGRGYAYTDTAYLIVGLVIEKVAASTYYDEVRRRFLVPLGLALTMPSDRRNLPGLAAGYSDPNNRFRMPAKSVVNGVLTWNPALEWTGGGFASNPKPLVRWAKALFEEKAMPAPYLAEMLAGMPGNPAHEPGGSRYGLGVEIAETPLGTSYGHGGWIPGHLSQLAYFPERKVAIAVQVNTDVSPVFERMSSYLLALATVVLDHAH
jgi:D-alanyl-D-alanine carboxypeptidase